MPAAAPTARRLNCSTPLRCSSSKAHRKIRCLASMYTPYTWMRQRVKPLSVSRGQRDRRAEEIVRIVFSLGFHEPGRVRAVALRGARIAGRHQVRVAAGERDFTEAFAHRPGP